MFAGRYRFVVASLLFGAGMINYMDRAALSVTAPLVRKDLGLSAAQLGLIFSSFFFGYALFCFIGGHLADRFGPRRVYAWAMALWSVCCGLTALVSGFFTLLFARVAFGVGEGPMCSTTNKAICNWFPRHETATMIGVTFAGQPLGSALAGPVVGLIAASYGWRIAFVVIAVIGLGWALAWRTLVTDQPAQHPKVHAPELRIIQESRAAHVPSEAAHASSLGAYLIRPSVLALAAGLFCGNYVLYFFLSWLPSYLVDAFHLSLRTMSVVSVIPWIGGMIGYTAGGILSDALLKRSGNGLWARKTVAIAALGCAAACIFLTILAASAAQAVALLAFATLFIVAVPQALWAMSQELVDAEHVGGVSGFTHALSNISGIIAPSVTGFALQWTGSYASSFVVAGAVALTGMVVLSLGIRTRAVPAAAMAGGSAA